MIRLSKAKVDNSELENISAVFFQDTHFGMGRTVAKFEEKIHDYLGQNIHVASLNSGTAALHAALECLRLPKGSEVLVPSITFIGSFQAITAAGHVPIATDVTLSGAIDPSDAEERISENTRAIMPVSYASNDFDRDSIYKLASKYRLRVVEDNAHAFGGMNSSDVKFGSSGDVSCFSFDGIKNLTCGEGGLVASSDAELIERVRTLRTLGIEKESNERFQGRRLWDFDVKTQGYRYHMSNINAAIGLAQFEKLDAHRKIKSNLYNKYCELLKEMNLLDFIRPMIEFNSKLNYHIFPCIISEKFERNRLREFLRERQIESGIHYACNHQHSLFRTHYNLPVSENIARSQISLPFHPDISDEDIYTVVKCIQEFYQT